MVKGLSELLQILRAAQQRVPQRTKAAVKKGGLSTQRKAKRRAKVRTGAMRKGIFEETLDEGYTSKVTANEIYSPFIEFGTGGSVSIPDGWEDIAAEFKGEGKRTVNIPAQPFMIPSHNEAKEEFLGELQTIISDFR